MEEIETRDKIYQKVSCTITKEKRSEQSAGRKQTDVVHTPTHLKANES